MKLKIFVIALLLGLTASAKTQVAFFFDAEDFTNPRSWDAIRDLSDLFRQEGETVHIALVGYLAQEIERNGRKDVLNALKPHIIGTQSAYHSRHPNVMELSDGKDYRAAYERVYKEEAEGIRMIEHATGKRVIFAVPPGPSKSYVAMYAYADMGLKFYCDTVIGDGQMGCDWYAANIRHWQYAVSMEQLIPTPGQPPEDEIITSQIEEAAGYPRAIFYLHPCMAVNQEFWDGLNYSHANSGAPGKWKLSAPRTEADTKLYFARLRKLIRRLRADDRFEFTTLEEIAAKEAPRSPIRAADAKRLAAHFELNGLRPFAEPSWCVADAFQAAVKFLKGEREHVPGKVYGFLERPYAVSKPVLLSASELREAAKTIDLTTFLPPSIMVGKTKIGPGDFLRAALKVIAEGADKVTVKPSNPLVQLDFMPPLKFFKLKSMDWVYAPEYKDEYTTDRLRLQVWTARDASRVEMAPGDLHAKDLTALKDARRGEGEPITLVRGKSVTMPIVCAAGSANEWAARELQATIQEMTGAKAKIVVERKESLTNAPAFFIGDTAMAKAKGLKAPGDHVEAFRVVTKEGSLFFLGKADFAVTDWCERELGARCYWPMKPNECYNGKGTNFVYGKCVVKTTGLKVKPVDWSDRPAFAMRDNWPYEGTRWNRWAKGGNSHRGGVSVHAPGGWWQEKDVTNHLEIFATSVDGGKPTSPLLCYGNPKTLEYYKQRILEEIAGKRKAGGIVNLKTKVITVSQWDCGVYCECKYCRKLIDDKLGPSGSGSPVIWGYFTRELAKWAKDALPGWKIAILPYINTCDVPPDPEDPTKNLDLAKYGNVEAELCTMPGLAMLKEKEVKEHEESLIRQWKECTGNPVINWHYTCWPAEHTMAPFVYGETVYRHYQNTRDCVAGSFLNGGFDMPRLILSVYVWMRCLWNPDVDVHAIYDGFARRMFGKAAPVMRELIRMQEAGWNREWEIKRCSMKNTYAVSYPRKDVLRMKAMFDEAFRLAKDDEKATARIKWYREGFEQFFRESEYYESGAEFIPLKVQKAMEPPRIDGKLDDPCWKQCEGAFMVPAGDMTKKAKDVRYPTEVKAVWYPGQGVTFAYDMVEPAATNLLKRRVGDYWGQDNVELFLDCSGNCEGAYCQMFYNITDNYAFPHSGGLKPMWKPKGVKTAIDIGQGRYSIEIYVPFDDLKVFPKLKLPTTSANGVIWTGNMTRWRVGDAKVFKEKLVDGTTCESTRLFTRGRFWSNDNAAFGKMIFVE